MKEGWDYKTIGEVIDHLRTGLNPRTHFKLNTPDAEGYYITVRELKGFAIEPDEKTDKVNRAAIKRINERSNLKIGDVLFSGTGTIGKTALVSELPVNWNIKEGVYAMTPKHSELNSKYFIYYIGSDLFLRLVNDKAAGTGVRSIPMKELVKLPIYIPSLSEQQSIVDYLDSAFAKVDAMKANAEKQLSEARALFQKALTKAMEPKEGWEEKKLEDLCTDIVDCPHSTPRKVDHPTKYPCIRTSELKGGKIEWESMQYLDEDEYIVRTARIKPQPNDIVYGREGTYGDAVLLPEGYYFSLGQRTMLFRPDVRCVEPKYLHYNVISSHVYEQAKAKNSGCGVGHVNVKDIKVFKIGVPPLSEQQRIVSRLDSLSAHVRELEEVLQKTIAECDALKQALLRQVFE